MCQIIVRRQSIGFNFGKELGRNQLWVSGTTAQPTIMIFTGCSRLMVNRNSIDIHPQSSPMEELCEDCSFDADGSHNCFHGVNHRDDRGQTALIRAVLNEHEKCMDVLLNKLGADPYITGNPFVYHWYQIMNLSLLLLKTLYYQVLLTLSHISAFKLNGNNSVYLHVVSLTQSGGRYSWKIDHLINTTGLLLQIIS